MIESITSQVPPHGKMERAALDGFLAGLPIAQPRGDALAALLAQDPAALSGRVLQISEIALSLLPVGVLSPEKKSIYARQDQPMLPTLVANIAEALRLTAQAGVRLDVAPDRLEGLLRQKQAYGTVKLLGMQMTNSAMDQRAVVGAFLAFLIDRTLEALDRRLRAPEVPAGEKAALLDDFAPALLMLEELLQRPIERRQELGALRKDLGAQAREAAADAAQAEVMLKLRQSLIVPREELLKAARRHQAQAQPGTLPGADATAGVAGLPPQTGPRRIV